MSTSLLKIELWTDGACEPNPGSGGWAYLLRALNDMGLCVAQSLKSGSVPDTTNNRMEIQALIEGLRALTRPTKLTVYSDSQLVLNCASGRWKRNKNLDLWNLVDQALEPHSVEWVWVKGHSGIRCNEIVDEHANRRARSQSVA